MSQIVSHKVGDKLRWILFSLHHRLTIFLICICVYSAIITVFYFKNPVQRFRYLSIHIKSTLLFCYLKFMSLNASVLRCSTEVTSTMTSIHLIKSLFKNLYFYKFEKMTFNWGRCHSYAASQYSFLV